MNAIRFVFGAVIIIGSLLDQETKRQALPLPFILLSQANHELGPIGGDDQI